MAPQPESETGSGDWRHPSKLKNMSISELISELRDSFLSSDFDRVEESLMEREARLKAEIDEKKREIGSLKERLDFERLERINAELELKKVRQGGCDDEKLVAKKNKNNDRFGLGDDGKVVKGQLGFGKSKLGSGAGGVFAQQKGGKVEVLEENKRSENQRKISELNGGKRVVVEINSCCGSAAPLKRNVDGVGASGGKLGTGDVIYVEDCDEEECNSRATMDRRETTSCTITDNEHQSSSGAVQKSLPARLAQPIGILGRKISSSRELITSINVLDGLDSDTSSTSSSSSSSSGSLDMDNLPLRSNKKMRTDATSLGLNSSLR